jgi:hypothetical protein
MSCEGLFISIPIFQGEALKFYLVNCICINKSKYGSYYNEKCEIRNGRLTIKKVGKIIKIIYNINNQSNTHELTGFKKKDYKNAKMEIAL